MTVKKGPDYIFKKLRSSYKFLRDLLQQVDNLKLDDEQREIRAVMIAAQLRTLLYDSGKSMSILSQLGIKESLFFMPVCADGQIDMASNLVPSYSLVDCQITSDGLYVCYKKPNHFSHRLNVFFNHWWNEIVIDTKGAAPVRLSRRGIVLTLCDKEGGAHLDPEFTDEYYEVNYNFGYKIVKENQMTTLMITHNMRDAITYGNRLIMFHMGHIIYDVKGEEKQKLTVEDLLKKFDEADQKAEQQ